MILRNSYIPYSSPEYDPGEPEPNAKEQSGPGYQRTENYERSDTVQFHDFSTVGSLFKDEVSTDCESQKDHNCYGDSDEIENAQYCHVTRSCRL